MEKKNKIYKICKDILKITDEEITEVIEIYNGQLNYNHPLKMGVAAKQRKLGKHNKEVMDKLIDLKMAIEKGADI